MNILIPHTWLLEHLETTATPEEIQRLLSLSGPSVERIYEIEGEPVYDIEVTTNRVDSMSVRGIAREAAVILSQAGIDSQLKSLSLVETGFKPVSANDLPLPRIFNDPKLCKRIMCQVIANVKRNPSPEWLQKRLRQVGINTHDIVIDTTNYLTHELGVPCHAFDYDRVMELGGEVHVKKAAKGKKFAIIDGTEFETVGGEVVFENHEGMIIDLPAIKGTQNTSIQSDTKNVLFWFENLEPKAVRFASMTHAIRTVAAQLSEKAVDPHSADDLFDQGIKLFVELANGLIASERYDDFSGKRHPKSIHVQLARIEEYLGISLEVETVETIMTSLGCIVKFDGEAFEIMPPTFRSDLVIPQDVIEEVARIYGYHNLPSVLMSGLLPTQRTDDRFELEHNIKQFFATLGAYEVYTYSMISEAQAQVEAEFIVGAQHAAPMHQTHLQLKNPLTDDLVYLRRTLWSQHLEVLKQNQTKKELAIFEFANVYIPVSYGRDVDREARAQSKSKDKDSQILPFEELHLTLTGKGNERRLKGMIESLIAKFHMQPVLYVPTPREAEIKLLCGDIPIGHMVLFAPSTLLQSPVTIIDLDWKTLLANRKAYPSVKAESKFTPIIEDLTFTVPDNQHVQRVLETIASVASVTAVKLKDVFKRNATFSLTYEADRQLTAEDATEIRKEIIELVHQSHQSNLVGL